MRILLATLLVLFCGCPSPGLQDLPDETDVVDGESIELPPDVNAALVDAMKPALGQGIAKAINQYYLDLYRSLGIEGEAETSLMNAVFENMEQKESVFSITIHGNEYKNPESKQVSVSGIPYIQMSRIPCKEQRTYAIVVQSVNGIPIKMFQLDLVNEQDWEYSQIEISTINIGAEQIEND